MPKNKNKKINKDQGSFYFEEYLNTKTKLNNNKLSSISEDRVYLLFFCFVSLILIFSLKIIFLSFQSVNYVKSQNDHSKFLPLRKDIVDRNGVLLSRNILTYHAAIRPQLINDKKKFLVKLKLVLPKLDTQEVYNKLNNEKYFYIKKRLTEKQKKDLWELGEKAIVFEPFQTRIYPHSALYSHIIGQIDYDNYGISGVESYFDKFLQDVKNIEKPLQLSLDTNLQYIIKSELERSNTHFNSDGSAALLMDAENGEVLSLVSLPDYNINERSLINKEQYTNKITKGVFELGSIFKTFTVALALDENLIETNTIITDITKKTKCSVHEISDIKDFPKEMSVEDILIQSSNIGTIKIAKIVGEAKFKKFINRLKILETPKIELDELGTPLSFVWNKCKLETVSYGHGITTTPLQAATAYASLINGGRLISPTLKKNENFNKEWPQIVSEKTSNELRGVLRKVVTEEKGTASLANVFGYDVSGKTGTAQYYRDKNKNINTFISFFNAAEKKYVLLVMFDDPKVAKNLIYDYRGLKIKGTRNEAGWNAVYSAGKIIEKIGPILAINSSEVNNKYAIKTIN